MAKPKNVKDVTDYLLQAIHASSEVPPYAESHEITKVFVALLEYKEHFEPADVALCTNAMMSTLRMVPLQDTIYRDGRNRLMIRGREVKDTEAEKKILAAAAKLRNNLVWKLITEKVEFEAETIHRKATQFYDNVFANAALFFSQQVGKVITDLVGEDEEDESEISD